LSVALRSGAATYRTPPPRYGFHRVSLMKCQRAVRSIGFVFTEMSVHVEGVRMPPWQIATSGSSTLTAIAVDSRGVH
jgi:hypothetical protein